MHANVLFAVLFNGLGDAATVPYSCIITKDKPRGGSVTLQVTLELKSEQQKTDLATTLSDRGVFVSV